MKKKSTITRAKKQKDRYSGLREVFEDDLDDDFDDDDLDDDWDDDDEDYDDIDDDWDDDDLEEELVLPPKRVAATKKAAPVVVHKVIEEPEDVAAAEDVSFAEDLAFVEKITPAEEEEAEEAAEEPEVAEEPEFAEEPETDEVRKQRELATAEAVHARYAERTKRKKRAFGPVEIGMFLGGVAIVAILIIVFANLAGGKRKKSVETAGANMNGDALIAVQSIGNDGIASATARAERELAEWLEQMEGEQGGADQDDPELSDSDVTDPDTDDDFTDNKPTITVTLNMSSIEKDLKIKFINAKTTKMIASAAFVVDLQSKDGQKYTFTDDDMNGIIQKTDLKPGTYTVTPQAVEGYVFDKSSYSVVVKDKIEYAKVDVTGEVKTENEVDSSKEDTAKKEEQEVVLANTVEWVESTKTPIDGQDGYVEVDKTKIVDPGNTLVAGNHGSVGGYSYMTELTDNYVTGVDVSAQGASTGLLKGESITLLATVSGVGSDVPGAVSWASSEPSLATVSTSGTVTMIGDVTTDTTVVITASSEGFAQDGETHVSGTITLTLKAPEATVVYADTVTLDQTTAEKAVGTTLKLTATLKYTDESTVTSATDGKIKFESSDSTLATVTSAGVVKALKTGSVTITAKSLEADEHGDYPEATCTITIVNASITVTIDAKVTLYVGKEKEVPAKVVMNGETITTDGTAATKGYVTWSSSDTTIATVDEETGMVKPLKKGTFTLKAKSVEKGTDGNYVEASCTVTVLPDPETDTTTLLKDEKGNQVYILKDNKYIEATSADYYKESKFYIKGETQYKYTGWQVINANTYYFDKNGKSVTGEQVINGVKYTFRDDGRLDLGNATLGIDVSRYNGTINWTKVKESGVDFVIIRCGYRGSTQGAMVEDLNFKTNIKGATEAGLKVGVYFFSQAITEAEAVEEASMVLSLVKNYKLAYPIFIDTEPSGGRGDKMDATQRTKVCKAFCQTVVNSGYKAGIYASKYYYNNNLKASELAAFKIWVAQYSTTCTYAGKYDMWQYSSTGNISGISGNVDLNYSYGF